MSSYFNKSHFLTYIPLGGIKSMTIENYRVGKNTTKTGGNIYWYENVFSEQNKLTARTQSLYGQFLCGKMHQNALERPLNYAQQLSFDVVFWESLSRCFEDIFTIWKLWKICWPSIIFKKAFCIWKNVCSFIEMVF